MLCPLPIILIFYVNKYVCPRQFSGYDFISIQEATLLRVVISALEVVELCFGIVVIAAVVQRVFVTNESGIIRFIITIIVLNGKQIAPAVIAVTRDNGSVSVKQTDNIALPIAEIVVRMRPCSIVNNKRRGITIPVIPESAFFVVGLFKDNPVVLNEVFRCCTVNCFLNADLYMTVLQVFTIPSYN